MRSFLFVLGLLLGPSSALWSDEPPNDMQRLQAELEKLRLQIEADQTLAKGLFTELHDLKKERDAWQAEKERMQAELTKLRASLQQTQVDLKQKETEAEVYHKRADLFAGRLHDAEEKLAGQEKSTSKSPKAELASMKKPAAPVRGKVLRFNKDGLTVISLGADEGMSVGQELFVYRDGNTPVYLGKLTLSVVEAKMALGSFSSRKGVEATRLQEGDTVTTNLGE